jgi:DNA-binding NtrC family response regulator
MWSAAASFDPPQLAPPRLASSLPVAEKSAVGFAGLVGSTPRMQQLFARIAALAPQDTPVLISGEPGTGKHHVAQVLHALSQRPGPLLPVHATALPADDLARHLFGQDGVGRDGVTSVTAGLLERAHGGTLLFEELAELDAGGQRCLRQLLTASTYYRRGSTQLRPITVRVLALTSQPLLPLVQRGQLCAELIDLLSPQWLDLPPLRQRRADIPLLAARFLREVAREPIELPGPTLLHLLGHPFPGNVRELRAVLHQAAQLGSRLEPALLASLLERPRPACEARFAPGTPLATVEREMILMTLAAVDGNKKEAAALLGMSRGALYSRLQEYTAQARAAWRASRLDSEPQPRAAAAADATAEGATPRR